MAASLPRTITRPSPRRRRWLLLGGYIEVTSLAEWVRAWVAAAVLLGPMQALLWLSTRMPHRLGGRRTERTVERLWARVASRLVGLRFELSGLEHVDRNEQYVVVALHEGFADALALLRLPLDFTAVARDELATFPMIGRHLERSRHLLIRPEHPLAAAREVRREARDVLANGESLLLFPQGSILGIELAFQSGAFALARRLALPVLPIVVSGSHRVWEHPFSGRLRFNQRVTVTVLPPVPASETVEREREVERLMKRVALASPVPPRRFDPDRDGFWDGYRYEIDAGFPVLEAKVAAHRRAHARPEAGR